MSLEAIDVKFDYDKKNDKFYRCILYYDKEQKNKESDSMIISYPMPLTPKENEEYQMISDLIWYKTFRAMFEQRNF
jgi:hypothetical protein